MIPLSLRATCRLLLQALLRFSLSYGWQEICGLTTNLLHQYGDSQIVNSQRPHNQESEFRAKLHHLLSHKATCSASTQQVC
ncbi:hypothetical protein CI102_12422 [Trichoderma harzianum]|nr:hypothetical protein CI102_12422 [Trichoderma harzianum]